jgi:hypothetical protein
MKTIYLIILLVLVLGALTGCAARPNEFVNKAVADMPVAGFWQGLWHGFISPVTFVISLFNPAVGMYDVYNNGGWYNFGFLLGAGAILGGGGGGAARRRRS